MRNVQQLAAVTAVLLAVSACAASPSSNPDAKAMAIHERVITFDAEMDIPLDFMQGDKDAGKDTKMQVDLPKMDTGKLDGAAFVLFTLQNTRTPDNYAKARKEVDTKLAAIEKMLNTYPERIALARHADDVPKIVKGGKHFVVLSVVNAYPYGEDVKWLGDLYGHGLRMVAFNHAGNNQFADSNRPQDKFGDTEGAQGGLTALGKQAIAEMNRLGIIVDISQITKQAALQAVELSNAPVVASHVGVKAKVDTSRNLSDEEMKAIAAKGGVVHIVAFPSYLKGASKEQQDDLAAIEKSFGLKTFTDAGAKLPKEKMPEFQKQMAGYRDRWANAGASVVDMADSIDYAVKLIGIDHVGIATDMEHGGGIIGYKTAAEAPGLTKELVKRGYSERDIGKLWSGNFLRAWKAVEKAAGK
ncbi:MAG: membrane dipeptidase [Rhodospirillaceae bacterium]|nr:membrane dipeptidase [Rhodospirillaceae bacterium]